MLPTIDYIREQRHMVQRYQEHNYANTFMNNAIKCDIGKDLHAIHPIHPSGCLKKILILTNLKLMKKWTRLDETSPIWNFLGPYRDKHGLLYRRGLYECTTQNCTIEVTLSTNYTTQMADKDALILNVEPFTLDKNVNQLINQDNISQPPPDNQLWMFYSRETPLTIYGHRKYVAHLPVHSIWSYHSDSQIRIPFGYYQPRSSRNNDNSQELQEDLTKLIESKAKLIAWMGSNCYWTFWPRMQYVEQLGRYLPLDTYGTCGNLTCEKGSTECDQLISSYKFYLAVENGECEEYITEKFWRNALKRGVVPIVYGAPRESYEKLAPPNSFIYAGDFKSVKDLADYILKMDKRPDLYRKYLEWRNKGFIEYPRFLPHTLCDVLPLIERLLKGEFEKKPVSTYPWFNSTCRINPFNYRPEHYPTLQEWQPW